MSTWITPNLLLAVTTGLLIPAVIAVVYFIAQYQETRRTVEELRVTVHEIELQQERNMAVVRKWEACLHKEEVTRKDWDFIFETSECVEVAAPIARPTASP